jgi:hypothetical protein
MDDLDRDNLLVLTTFAGSVVAVIVGYLLAWRAKRTGTAPPDGTYKTALQSEISCCWLLTGPPPILNY